MSGPTNIVKTNGQEKYVYSDYGLEFDSKCLWSFNHDFARKVVIFRVDDILSSHSDNLKNDFLVLGEGKTSGINGSFGAPEKKI